MLHGTISHYDIVVYNPYSAVLRVCAGHGGSGVATPGPTRAQALVKFVCALR